MAVFFLAGFFFRVALAVDFFFADRDFFLGVGPFFFVDRVFFFDEPAFFLGEADFFFALVVAFLPAAFLGERLLAFFFFVVFFFVDRLRAGFSPNTEAQPSAYFCVVPTWTTVTVVSSPLSTIQKKIRQAALPFRRGQRLFGQLLPSFLP